MFLSFGVDELLKLYCWGSYYTQIICKCCNYWRIWLN